MAVTLNQLVAPQQIANSATTYYTAAVTTRIDKVSVTNPTATAATVTFYIVPSAGSVGDSTTITKTRSINTLETWTVFDLIGHVMNAGDTLRAVASAATTLTLMASGTQVTGT